MILGIMGHVTDPREPLYLSLALQNYFENCNRLLACCSKLFVLQISMKDPWQEIETLKFVWNHGNQLILMYKQLVEQFTGSECHYGQNMLVNH